MSILFALVWVLSGLTGALILRAKEGPFDVASWIVMTLCGPVTLCSALLYLFAIPPFVKFLDWISIRLPFLKRKI